MYFPAAHLHADEGISAAVCRGALTGSALYTLADTSAAPETATLGISSEDIVKLLKEKGKEAWYLPTFDEIEKFVMEHCAQGDLLITMGAGDVVNVGENLLAK